MTSFSVWFYKRIVWFELVSCKVDPRGKCTTSSSLSKMQLSVIFKLRLYVRKANGNWVFQTCSKRTLGTQPWCLNGSACNGPHNDATRLIIDSLLVATTQVQTKKFNILFLKKNTRDDFLTLFEFRFFFHLQLKFLFRASFWLVNQHQPVNQPAMDGRARTLCNIHRLVVENILLNIKSCFIWYISVLNLSLV